MVPPSPHRVGQSSGPEQGHLPAAQHARIKRRRGPANATGATRHSILVAAYFILRDGVPYRDLGADHFHTAGSTQAHVRRLVRQLEALGHQVTLQPVA